MAKIKITCRLSNLCTNYLQVEKNALSLKITASLSRNIGKYKFTIVEPVVEIRLCVQFWVTGLTQTDNINDFRNIEQEIEKSEAPKNILSKIKK